jgi:hypothetical protein
MSIDVSVSLASKGSPVEKNVRCPSADIPPKVTSKAALPVPGATVRIVVSMPSRM